MDITCVDNDAKAPFRIAHIAGKLANGGVENVIFNYYRAIDKEKIQFDIFYDEDSTYNPPEELIALGARFIKIPPYQKIWRYIPSLIKELKKGNYKIIHSHLNTLSVFPLFAAFCARVPVRIAHNHSVPDGNETIRNLLKKFLKLFSKVFATNYAACSEKAARWLFGNKLYEKGKIKLIRNAIDFKRFDVLKEQIIDISEKFGLKEKFVVGHVGRFTYAKNHNRLIEIFKCIRKNNSNAILLLVGDGELREEIKEKISAEGLEKNIILVGSVKDVELYYSLMDVMIYPSFFEGFSMACIEAQICGVPVVATPVVPEEAIISSGFAYLSLDNSDSEWSDIALKISESKPLLKENTHLYDINISVKELETWYFYLEKQFRGLK